MKTLLFLALASIITPALGLAQRGGEENDYPFTNLKCENSQFSMRVSTDGDMIPTLSLKAKAANEVSELAKRLLKVNLSNPVTGEIKIVSSGPCQRTESSKRMALTTCTKTLPDTTVSFIDENGSVYPWTTGPAIYFQTVQKKIESARGDIFQIELEMAFYKHAKETVTFDIEDCYSF